MPDPTRTQAHRVPDPTRIVAYAPRETVAALDRMAQREGRSRSNMITALIDRANKTP